MKKPGAYRWIPDHERSRAKSRDRSEDLGLILQWDVEGADQLRLGAGSRSLLCFGHGDGFSGGNLAIPFRRFFSSG